MKKTVCLLATGGTISGEGAPGQSARYVSGSLAAENLLRGMPALPEDVEVRCEQICNIQSDDITAELWFTLAGRIRALAEDPGVCGFVITHGTNTMEETAFFLYLTLWTDKPVVLTGAMRPATAAGADGPMNLWQSICLAASPDARGLGVLVCFSDAIYDARNVQKVNAFRPQAFSSRDYGCLGVMRDQRPFLRLRPEKPVFGLFSQVRPAELPRVDVVTFHAGAAADLLDHSAARAKGIILAGAGAGDCSKAWEERLKEITGSGIPVIRTSRTGSGIVVRGSVDDDCGTLPGYDLPAVKLRILLSLCLAEGMSLHQIRRVLETV